MVHINLHQFKAHLSRYARQVRQGKTIVVCVRNRPFAELRPLASAAPPRPAPGLFKGQIELGDSFFSTDEALEREMTNPLEPPPRRRRRATRHRA